MVSEPSRGQPLLAPSTPGETFVQHWPVYIMEGVELGLFMFSACAFGTLCFYAGSPVVHHLPSPLMRLVLMGLVMGVTAVVIIRSPIGVRSGAHFNPSISLTFFCLGRMYWVDMVCYIAAQFTGGAFGVWLAKLFFKPYLAAPSVRYVITVPGRYGTADAFWAELFMGFLTMSVVLVANAHRWLSRYTWLWVGLLVTAYVILFSPVSGFSLNPARTVSSALFAGVWTTMWLYFSAPLLGMLLSARLYVLTSGSQAVYCGKLFHDLHSPCPFRCQFQHFVHSNITVNPSTLPVRPPKEENNT